MGFPNNCIRGIPNNDFLLPDGSIASHLFYFKQEQVRYDQWIEQSINWQDDDSAIEFTLGQKKEDGQLHFNAGVVIIPRDGIDSLNRLPAVHGMLSYERQPLADNYYHGNILLKAGLPKHTMKYIAASLALAVSNIIPQS